MIFLDANIFLRVFVFPDTAEQQRMQSRALRLFSAAEAGELTLTTSDAVIAEVLHVLAGPVYQLSIPDSAERLSAILRTRGMRGSMKPVWFLALEILAQRPSLKFVDALAAAYSITRKMELATFDRKLACYPGVTAYEFPG